MSDGEAACVAGAARQLVAAWIEKADLAADQCPFASRRAQSQHLSSPPVRTHSGLPGTLIGLDAAAYGTYTMRRTMATLIYRRTKTLRAVQLLLGHTKLESTVRHLGIEVDDALEIAEQTEA
jgi:site-specific recombinase XerC